MEKLKKGYKLFFDSFSSGKFNHLGSGQSPQTMVVSCSDSRADPAIITSAEPGDLFMIRNVANIVPPFEEDHSTHHGVSSAIEFGVKVLKVKNILIIGHSDCSGIKTLVDGKGDFIFVNDWVNILRDIKIDKIEHTKECYSCVSKKGVVKSIENLKTFPFVVNAINSGDLEIFGWFFDVETFKISELIGDEFIEI